MYSLTAKSVPHRFPFYGRHQRKRIPRNIFPQPQIGSKNWGRSFMREEESKWRWNGLANGLASLFHYWIYILHNWRLLVMDPRDFKTPKQDPQKLKIFHTLFLLALVYSIREILAKVIFDPGCIGVAAFCFLLSNTALMRKQMPCIHINLSL